MEKVSSQNYQEHILVSENDLQDVGVGIEDRKTLVNDLIGDVKGPRPKEYPAETYEMKCKECGEDSYPNFWFDFGINFKDGIESLLHR